MGIKHKVNETFFDTWSAEMAYVLGYLYADGSMEDASYLRGKYVRVTSVEKHAIINIKRLMNAEHRITAQESTWPNGRIRYGLRIGSHKLYDSLTKRGLYPNKSLTIKFPNISDEYLRNFVRGYLDGDGCVYLERKKGKTQKSIIKKLTVIFTSGSKDFLRGLEKSLRGAVGTRQGGIYQGHRSYQLRYSTADSIRLFGFLYGKVPHNLYFKRKLKPFLMYFRLRPTKIDISVKATIEYLQHGHVVK